MDYLKKFNETKGIRQWRVELKPELALLHATMKPSQARLIIKSYNAAIARLTANNYKRSNEKVYDTNIVNNMTPEKLLQLIEYSQIILKTNQYHDRKRSDTNS